PGVVFTTEFAVYLPLSKAIATVSGFMVEPGSKESTAPRLRMASLLSRLFLSFGLYDGHEDSARISPVLTSTAIAVAERALLATPAAVSSRYIIYCRRESILRVIFSPGSKIGRASCRERV